MGIKRCLCSHLTLAIFLATIDLDESKNTLIEKVSTEI